MAKQAEPDAAVGHDRPAAGGIARLAGERLGNGVTHDLLRKIIEVVDADCLKDTSYEPAFVSQRVLQFHDKLSVLVGTNAFFFSNMLLGAGGFIGSQADLFGDRADRFYDFEKMTEAERRERGAGQAGPGHAEESTPTEIHRNSSL